MNSETIEANALVTSLELAQRLPPKTPDWVTAGLLSITGMAELNERYANLDSTAPGANLFEQALAQLGIDLRVDANELRNVPESGPAIVISNHPFGGADGLSLGAAMLRRRTDVRIITNEILGRIAKLAPWFLNVNVFDAKRRASSNARQIRTALKHLRGGGLLVVFPAGAVSQFRPDTGMVTDRPWSNTIAMLARRSHATVVPCFFEGSNSPMFRAAGLLHPNLSTLLLPRELLARRDSTVRLTIGRSISPATCSRFADAETLTAWMRVRTYDLQHHASLTPRKRYMQPIAEAVDSARIDWELAGLPRSQLLLQQGTYRVYWANHADIPGTIEEIARLREITFRAVGEGSGAARDLDVFDQSYKHLVLYDAERKCIVGSYRFAFCDKLIQESGFAGLYSNQLFHYKSSMRRELNDAVELGRSFVRTEYQRNPLALALLWRGIGELLVRNRCYRRLIGAVSISDRYRGSARRMLVAFLNECHSDVELRRHVQPRRPIRVVPTIEERSLLAKHCRSTKELSHLISELGTTIARVPVLLERYLELGARVLALSTDPAFGDCIDALVVVDLDRAREAVLRRFMGSDGYATYSAVARAAAG